ncbi:MAG: hypothetical protein V1708_03925 [Candidatus Micrarchaeota archaeon]
MANVDTSIDRLVEYVKLKKSTSVEEASKALSMPAREVEELSEILAESALINLKYEFSGIRLTPKLVKADIPGAGLRSPAGKSALSRVGLVNDELKSATDMFAFSQKDIARRIEAVRTHFREIEATQVNDAEVEQLQRQTLELMRLVRILEANCEALRKEASSVEDEMAAFQTRLEQHPKPRRGFLGRIRSALSRVVRRRKA